MNLAGGTLSSTDTVSYLRTLPAIRERCSRVFALAQQNQLQYFVYDVSKEGDVAEFCAGIMQRDFGASLNDIPPHGRWRHLDAGAERVSPLIQQWQSVSIDKKEICKRLIDLFLVSVLLDAGAGNAWTYRDEKSGTSFSRSEGLAVASFHMFDRGMFSSDSSHPHRVDARGLQGLSAVQISQAMQVDLERNPMAGIEGRSELLSKLGAALHSHPEWFGPDGRPGDILDFLETETVSDGDDGRCLHVSSLWHVLIYGLESIWPSSRTTLDGVALGDVWPCKALESGSDEPIGSTLVPFHKLTGWITYSLMEPVQRILGWKIEGVEDMTGLPEYRNGGLMIDFGVLTLRKDALESSPFTGSDPSVPRLAPSHPAIVEWRALTVILLDRIADQIRSIFKLLPEQLTLAQVLESATWKGGREIAKQKRPETGGPPIDIISDGTVF